MSVPPPLWEALVDSIFSGVFVDTKFVVPSKRNEITGRIEERRTLFANSHVVKSVPILASRFKDDPKSTEEKPCLDDYDYSSDSDFDFEDTDKKSLDASHHSSARTNGPRDSSELSTATLPTEYNSSVMTSSPRICHTILVRDAAFITFQALLLYLYTREVRFAPRGGAPANKPEVDAEMSHGIQRPSAKSIYRLATKYKIPHLKELALREIRDNLRSYSLQDEVFSKLSARHPELRDLFLHELEVGIRSSEFAINALQGKFKEYTAGKLPHARDAIVMLYDLLSGNKHLGPMRLSAPNCEPPSTSQQVGRGQLPDWDSLKDALMASLTTGVFIDCKFYAPVTSDQSNNPPNLQPLHFCCSINPGVIQKLSSELLEPMFNPRSQTINQTQGDGQITPTLMFGDWRSWRSILMYMYTTEVSFSPSLNPPIPPQEISCAPKLAYMLSDKVGLLALRNLALHDIRSKMKKENITEELFSKFSSEYSEVQEMQHKLLQKELRGTEATSGIRQKILESSLGHDPHHTAAIMLVFKGLASSTQNVPIPFSTAATTRSNPGSHNLPDFTPYHEVDTSCHSITLAFQSISCMPQYQSLSHEEIRVHHYCGMPIQLGSGISTSQPTPTIFGESSPNSASDAVAQTNGGASLFTHSSYEHPPNGHRRKRR